MLKILLTIWIAAAFLCARGQDVTVINQFNGTDEKLAPESYVLKNVTEHTYIINEYELANTSQRSFLDAMIRYGLRSYIDSQFHVFDGRIEAIDDSQTFQIAAADIVKNAIWIHDLPFGDDFPGFSDMIKKKAAAIKALDGFLILKGDSDMNAPAANEVGLYTFQRLVYELKKYTEMEVAVFLNAYMPGSKSKNYSDSKSSQLNEEDFRIKPSYGNRDKLNDIEPDPNLLFGDPSKEKKNKKSTSETDSELAPFAEKVVQLLEQNSKILAQYNDRFENLQIQIDDVRNQQPNDNSEVRKEIAELRDMIRDLAAGKAIHEKDESSTHLVTNEVLNIIFDKNAHEVTLAQKAKLNNIEITLRENPGYIALITGFADKTGNPEFNAWISKQRANSVKAYLQSRGITADQLIVNFLGDTESDAPNPEDRKVTIAYLTND